MLAREQNPAWATDSLEQTLDTHDNEDDTNFKPFSIREYVLAAREKNLSCSWPFLTKHLQVCLIYGISNVLPPFEPHDMVRDQSSREDAGLNCFQEDKNAVSAEDHYNKVDKKVEFIKAESDHPYFDEGILEVSVQVSHFSLPSDSCKYGENSHLSSDTTFDPTIPGIQPSISIPSIQHYINQARRLSCKQKKLKRRSKKRSMLDICAVAKPCTLEDLDRADKLAVV